LTSARWQILGAIISAERPQPVAWIARDLGANRQNVPTVAPSYQTTQQRNAAEEGDTANIKQNKTNKGFFRGRREG
jgi:hypothetical protein